MELQFKITNDHISEVGLKIAPVADSVNHLYAAFEFDDAWDGAVKTAIFGGGGKTYHVILKSDNKCVIPWEVLTGPCFTVSAFGITGTERITATELKIPLAPSGYKNGQSPSEPSDSAYTQLLQMLSWVITNKAALTKFAEGSTDVPDMINVPTEDGSITLREALDGKADTSALGSYYTKDEVDNSLSGVDTQLWLINEQIIGKADTSELAEETSARTAADAAINSTLSDLNETVLGHGNAVFYLENNAQLKTTITTKTGSTVTVSMDNNTETRCGEVTALTLNSFGSQTPEGWDPNDLISSVVFTSGTTATSLTYSDTITMIGTDCIDGVLAPVAGKRYTVIVAYDGAGLVGYVAGHEVTA